MGFDSSGGPRFTPTESAELPRLRTDEVADVLQVVRVRILRHLARRGLVVVDADALEVQDDLAERDGPLAQLAAAAVSGLPPAGPLCTAGLCDSPPCPTPGPRFVARWWSPTGASTCTPAPARARWTTPAASRCSSTSSAPRSPTTASCSPPTARSVSPSSESSRTAPTPSTSTPWPSSSVSPPPSPRPGSTPSGTPASSPPPLRYARGSSHHPCRPWHVETCPRCGGRMKLVALVKDPHSARRVLGHLGLPTEPPPLGPARGPPFARSPERRLRPSPQADMFDDS